MSYIGRQLNLPASVAQLTAEGAITAGKPCVVEADGDVAQVASVSQSAGTPVTFESAAVKFISVAYDANAQKIVIAYEDDANSDYGTAVVGTVSGDSISFGTPVVYESASTQYHSVVYDENAQKVVIAYKDSGNSNYGTAIVGTVSGTSISFGSAAVFESGATNYISTAYDSDSQKVVIGYQDYGNSSYGTAIVGTVSGTSISFGSATVFESAATNFVSVAYDSNAQKIVIAYEDDANGDNGTAIVGTVSGTSISFGTAAVFESAITAWVAAAYDSSSQKVVIGYQDYSNSQHGTAVVATVSGTSISFGTPVVFESAEARNIFLAYDSQNQKMTFAYRDGGNSNQGTVIAGTVSGTSISFGSALVYETGSTDEISAAYDSDTSKIVIGYRDTGDSSYGKAVVFQNAGSNLTSENFIGFAENDSTDNGLATIQLGGSVNDKQTSLTAGQTYFVQTDGTIGTTADSPSVTAGTAVSATEILVKG